MLFYGLFYCISPPNCCFSIAISCIPFYQHNIHDTLTLLCCKIQYGGIPTLSHDDHCRDCLICGAQTVVSADTYRGRRESLKSLARDILDGNCLDGKYFISRPWYDNKSSFMAYMLPPIGNEKSVLFLVFGNSKYLDRLDPVIDKSATCADLLQSLFFRLIILVSIFLEPVLADEYIF